MNIIDIAKTVGASAFSVAVPGGAAILSAVNQMLPDDAKLPVSSTGNDIRSAVSSLPVEQQADILTKEFDVDLTQIRESNETLREMLRSDAANPHTTRPYIAKGSFQLIAALSLVVITLWAYGVAIENEALVKTVMDGWPFVAAILAPFVMLLRSYFGVLRQEHQNRLRAASGDSAQPGIQGIISSILSRK